MQKIKGIIQYVQVKKLEAGISTINSTDRLLLITPPFFQGFGISCSIFPAPSACLLELISSFFAPYPNIPTLSVPCTYKH